MSKPDWEAIESAYRAGILSLREIAVQHGISEGSIRKRAKKNDWVRNGGIGTQKGTQCVPDIPQPPGRPSDYRSEYADCSGQLKLAIDLEFIQYRFSDSFGGTALALGNFAQISGVKDSVQTGTFATAIGIRDDGDKTRALITANENAMLNRQLGVLETTLLLERHGRGFDRDHNSLVIQNTNTANAMQQQQQQGFQVSRLFDMIHCCDQNIRATNQAINIGSGAQIATPTNTSTNNHVN